MSVTLPARHPVLTPQWVKNELWRRARAVPSLDLRFAETKSLVDATTGTNLIDFTRASSGTYVGSDGLIKTATTNLLLRSEEFETTWTPTNTTVSVNQIVAPNGAVTADKILETATTGEHNIRQDTASQPAGTYTVSIFAKAAERNVVQLVSTGVLGGFRANFDLANGVLGSVDAQLTASIVPFANGWYRCIVTATSTTSGTLRAQWNIVTSPTSARVESYLGDVSKGLYLWGAQLEQSSTVGEYVKTTSTINSAPRFDHDPTTGESLGLLVEEQRTNSIRNNTMVGAVAGTPGTLPTNWSESLAGLTRQVVGTGIENGISYIDIRLSGTSTGTQAVLRWEGGVTASDGQSWAHSVWLARTAGTLPSANVVLSANLFNASSVYLADTNGIQIKSAIGSSLSRVSGVNTISTANTATARPYIYFLMANGEAVDFTLRIGMPQFEQGAFATSVIPTTGTAVTRAADVASISGSNYSSWFDRTKGTVFAEFAAQAVVTRYVMSASNNSSAELLYIRNSATGSDTAMASGSVTQAFRNINYSRNNLTNAKHSFGYETDNFDVAAQGATSAAGPDTSCAVPVSITRFDIGSLYGTSQMGGTIKRLTYWPTRLPNETLQGITQ